MISLYSLCRPDLEDVFGQTAVVFLGDLGLVDRFVELRGVVIHVPYVDHYVRVVLVQIVRRHQTQLVLTDGHRHTHRHSRQRRSNGYSQSASPLKHTLKSMNCYNPPYFVPQISQNTRDECSGHSGDTTNDTTDTNYWQIADAVTHQMKPLNRACHDPSSSRVKLTRLRVSQSHSVKLTRLRVSQSHSVKLTRLRVSQSHSVKLTRLRVSQSHSVKLTRLRVSQSHSVKLTRLRVSQSHSVKLTRLRVSQSHSVKLTRLRVSQSHSVKLTRLRVS